MPLELTYNPVEMFLFGSGSALRYLASALD